jgi:hypothetical protein
MKLTREDLDAVMEAQGVRGIRGFGIDGTELDAEQMATRMAQRPASGEMPFIGGAPGGGSGGGPRAGAGMAPRDFGGGGMAGGFGGGTNSGASAEQLATLRAQRAETGATMVPAPLLEALITLLEASA